MRGESVCGESVHGESVHGESAGNAAGLFSGKKFPRFVMEQFLVSTYCVT